MNEFPALKQMGLRIRKIRTSQHMSQFGLACLCNFEKSSMSRIESGKTNLTLLSLYKISVALNVDITELLKD